jgi:hypothetical protein
MKLRKKINYEINRILQWQNKKNLTISQTLAFFVEMDPTQTNINQ